MPKRPFKDAPIRRKLTYVAILASGAALLFAALALLALQWFQLRAELVKDADSLSTLIAANSKAALVFNDAKSARRTLAALGTQDEIDFAMLHDKEGKPFAMYLRPGATPPEQHVPRDDGHYFDLAHLEVFHAILLDGKRVGTIHLRASLARAYTQMVRDVALMIAAALGGLGVALAMISRLHPAITGPIGSLVGLMNAVAGSKDFSLRADVGSRDELGALAAGFNDMLARIQARDDALARHGAHLEQEVAQRTAELRQANVLLEQELAERKQAEQALHESEETFRVISTSAQDAIIMIDNAGKVSYWNPAAEKIFGYTWEEVRGRNLHALVVPERYDQAYRRGFELFRLGGDGAAVGKTLDLTALRKGGEEFSMEISLSAVKLGERWNAVGIVRDVTERKRVDEEIRRLNEQLEQKVRERTGQLLAAQDELVRKERLAVLGQVAGSVGHELRNPLGVMNNAVYFLQTVLTDADETTREYLGIIKDEIAVAERIVSDLLDSVRIKPPHFETVGVETLIGLAMRRLTLPDTITVRMDVSRDLPSVRVDAMQIQQVLCNLVNNAAEAMPDGGELDIRARREGPAVAVSVSDSGAGVTPEHLARLFQPLFTTKARGIGLGLVVVKNLVEANGGSVEAQSEANSGATFTIRLPVEDAVV